MIKILLLLLFPVFCLSQQKKDNAVIVHGVTFTEAVQKMIDMGYHPDKIDKDFKTAQYPVDQYQTVYIRFDTVGNMIVTSDLFIPGNMFAQHSPVLYWKSSFNAVRWNEMMKYAGTFPNRDYANLKH